MSNLITFFVGLLILAVAWYIARTIAKFIQSVINMKDNQEEILQQLEEIKTKLEEIEKNNSNK